MLWPKTLRRQQQVHSRRLTAIKTMWTTATTYHSHTKLYRSQPETICEEAEHGPCQHIVYSRVYQARIPREFTEGSWVNWNKRRSFSNIYAGVSWGISWDLKVISGFLQGEKVEKSWCIGIANKHTIDPANWLYNIYLSYSIYNHSQWIICGLNHKISSLHSQYKKVHTYKQHCS